jgi:ArsR family transcriptional regulator
VEELTALAALFKALSEQTRLRILKLLEAGELCVCDITAALGMSQPKVSFHLGVLREAGLVKDRKQGKWTHYRISDDEMFRRLIIVSVLEKVPEEAVRQDRRRLAEFLRQKAEKGVFVGMPRGAEGGGRV